MYESLEYDSPVLYDQSETITDQFTIHPQRKKALIIADERSLNESFEKFFDELIENKIEHETIVFNHEVDLHQLNTLLYRQTMGTQLYIASRWDEAVTIFREAVTAGFTEDEIQVFIDGKKRRYVYCMKCYTLNEVGNEKTTTCFNCGITLEVGPFFSKVRKGYIGYLIPPEQT